MNIKGLLATAAMTAGLAVRLAATATAAPVSDDFWECVADHQDADGIGVCCVFYGGDYDERSGECWIDHEAKLEEANPGPSVPPERASADATSQHGSRVAGLVRRRVLA